MRRVYPWVLIGVSALFAMSLRAGEVKKAARPEVRSEGLSGLTYAEARVLESGTLTGTVTYAGVAPAPKQLAITKDKPVCGKEPHYDESLIVAANRGLKNVVVSITNVPKGKDLKSLGAEFSLRQTGCVFTPHVVVVPIGVPLKIFNDDGILHNIHTYSAKNPPFNIAQPKFMKKVERTFKAPEVVSVKCDVHGWMNAYIVVTDHPYYDVTDANGRYTLTEVPPGSYQVEFWHEKLGKSVQQVKVTAGAETKLDYVFPAAGK